MADTIQDFVNEVTESQERVAEQRADVASTLVDHMLKLPGMSDIFDTDQEKQAFGMQVANMIEFAARQRAERAVMQPPPPPPEPPPADANGGGQTE